MTKKILYTPEELHEAQQRAPCFTLDCRFNLADAAAGCRAYQEGHIPGAVYAHLDDDLSSPVTATSGRHPLPEPAAFAAFLARCGWRPGMLLVAYDDGGGAIAARAWWLMKYFGHDCAALLDGGLAAWRAAGFSLESGVAEAGQEPVTELVADADMVLSTAEVADALKSGSILLADARAPERFRGQVEPIDTVAGHVPGARNYPNAKVLTKAGRLRPAGEIRQSLQELLETRPPGELAHMCGSGVTACLNLFAAELAGLQGGRLYAGSWSEWIRDRSRPVATG